MRQVPAQSPALVDHTHARVAPGSVDTLGIMDDAVTTAKILDGTILSTDLNVNAYGTVGQITAIDPDDAAVAGATGKIADAGHQHPATTGIPAGLIKTATNDESATSTLARAGHQHATNALPWGIVARQVLTANSASWSADATTDFALAAVPVDSARLYRVGIHTPMTISAAARWLINFHVGGVLTDRLFDLGNLGGTFDWTIDASVLWTPTTGTPNIDVRVDEITDGANLQFIGAATAQRWFYVEDIGPR